MPITLFDPSSQTKQPIPAGALPEARCAATRGPSEGLALLRQAVFDDLLQRLLGAHEPVASTVTELAREHAQALGRHYDAVTLQYWILTVHYRTPLELAIDGDADAGIPELDACERSVGYLAATKQRLLTLPASRIIPVQTAPADALAVLPDAVERALEDDLDAPAALAAVQSFLAAVNALCDGALRKQGRVNASAVACAEAGFLTIATLLGLGADAPFPLLERLRDQRAKRQRVDPIAVESAVVKRAAARSAKDFTTADAIQAGLLEQGITLLDGPDGTSWTFV